MTVDIEKLKALALAATPGEWTPRPYGRVIGGPLRHYVNGSAQAQIASFAVTFHEQAPNDEPERQQANAEFCAAANPAAVLDLIAEVERLRAEKEAPDLAALDIVKELSRISMSLAADLVQGAGYTFQGHDYLDRNAVVERVMQWRIEWDATRVARAELAARCRAEVGDTSENMAVHEVAKSDAKPAETRMVTGFGDCARGSAPAAGTVKDAELADALNTTLWLYRRLPHAYGKPPFVDKAILTMAARLGMDDVPAAIKERAAIEAHTKAAKENA